MVAFILMILFNMFLGVVYVNGNSMEPLYLNGDILIVKKWGSAQNGEVVTAYIEKIDCVVVKRILASGGDHVKLTQDAIYLNGEFFIAITNREAGTGKEFIVPADHYFLIGDNGGSSLDSRELGCVEKENIQGIVVKKIL